MRLVPASLRGRLSLGAALVIVALWSLGAGAALTALERQTATLFDSALQETTQRLVPLAVADWLAREDDPEGDAGRRVARGPRHEEVLTYVVRDETGRVVLASHDADPAMFPPDPPKGFSSTASHRLYAEQALSGTLTLIAAEPLALRKHAIQRAMRALVAPLLIVAPLTAVGVWALVAWSMAPVRRLAGEIGARGGGDLRPLASQGLPDEMRPVAGAVDALMLRVRQTLDAERRFAANAAHELRTPIAAALAQTQRLAAEAETERTRARARTIEDRLHGLSRLAEKLMQLARAQGAQLLREAPQDLAPVFAVAIDEARRATGLGARLRVETPETALLSRVDPDALAILLRNLVENAARHGDGEAPVRVSFDGARLIVVNRGPTLSPDTLARLTRPFERGDTQAPGSGLGLAIVSAIARETGARLAFASPAPGAPDGLEARLDWPA